MIKLVNDGKGKSQSWEAEATDVDLPANVNFGVGATQEEAVNDLKARVSDYIEYLQGIDWTVLPHTH